VQFKHTDTAILVFCKAPIAGQVKTRLMPQLSAEQAVNVHELLTEQILSLLTNDPLCHVQLWCSPDTQHSFFAHCTQNYAVSLHPQQGEDLGERMYHAICKALETSNKVLLIGCDCPSLTIEDIEIAINALDNDCVVFSPAEDGGYVMVAMTKPHPELFLDLSWGHEKVLENSLQRAGNNDLTIVKTKLQWDVDDINDLIRFRNLNKTANPKLS